MIAIYTIGYTKKSAEEFFSILKRHNIRQVVDIRENNTSQLAGFTKKDDLRFFVKEMLSASYIHLPQFAPDKEIRDRYKEAKDWQEYESSFLKLMTQRGALETLRKELLIEPLVLLCSELKADKCHRRLIARLLKEYIYAHAETIHL